MVLYAIEILIAKFGPQNYLSYHLKNVSMHKYISPVALNCSVHWWIQELVITDNVILIKDKTTGLKTGAPIFNPVGTGSKVL